MLSNLSVWIRAAIFLLAFASVSASSHMGQDERGLCTDLITHFFFFIIIIQSKKKRANLTRLLNPGRGEISAAQLEELFKTHRVYSIATGE